MITMKHRGYHLLMVTLLVLGYVTSPQAQGNSTDAIWGIAPQSAEDLNPDPTVVEVELIASVEQVKFGKSQWTDVWTYNGSTPGPTIEANIGDTIVVHFYNLLPEETTVHWHGVEVPANMDGSHIAQTPSHPADTFATSSWH